MNKVITVLSLVSSLLTVTAQAETKDYCKISVSGSQEEIALHLPVSNAELSDNESVTKTVTTQSGESFRVKMGRSASFAPNTNGKFILNEKAGRSISVFVFSGDKVVASNSIILPAVSIMNVYDSKDRAVRINCGTTEADLAWNSK